LGKPNDEGKITDENAAELKKAFPKCEIFSDFE